MHQVSSHAKIGPDGLEILCVDFSGWHDSHFSEAEFMRFATNFGRPIKRAKRFTHSRKFDGELFECRSGFRALQRRLGREIKDELTAGCE